MQDRKVAIIAKDDLLLDALIESWESSNLAEISIVLVSLSGEECSSVLFRGRPLSFRSIEDVDFDRMQLVIVLESRLTVETHKELLRSLSCPLLGYMDSLEPLAPEIFSEDGDMGNRVYGLVQPPVAALQDILRGHKCKRLDLTLLYPVSAHGRLGVGELASQTVRLLNAQPPEYKVFDKQMPFNYFPMVDGVIGGGLEKQLLDEFEMVFINAHVHVTAIQMPVFHGLGILASVVLDEKVDLDSLSDKWAANQRIHLESSIANLSIMEVSSLENQILIGSLKKSRIDEHRFDCWLSFDDIKYSAGIQLISAAGFLLKYHL